MFLKLIKTNQPTNQPTKTGKPTMDWHRIKSAKTAYQNRKLKAHIVDWARYGNFAICGRRAFIYVNKLHIGNRENNVCLDCKRKSGIVS